MPTHTQQPPRNPWQQDNPSSYDMLMMRTEQNMSSGMPRLEAEAFSAQEILAAQKAGDHPMGMINAHEATNNGIEGSRNVHRMEQERTLKRQEYNPYAATRADGLSFGDYMNQQYSAQQSPAGRNGINNLGKMRLTNEAPAQAPTYTGQGFDDLPHKY